MPQKWLEREPELWLFPPPRRPQLIPPLLLAVTATPDFLALPLLIVQTQMLLRLSRPERAATKLARSLERNYG